MTVQEYPRSATGKVDRRWLDPQYEGKLALATSQRLDSGRAKLIAFVSNAGRLADLRIRGNVSLSRVSSEKAVP
jgi:hypothetical protein